jgi:hypothetical protein
MNYKYLFWLLIGLIIGYIYQINNIEGFKNLTGCPDDGTHTTQDDSFLDNEISSLGIIDSLDQCQPNVDEGQFSCTCKNRYKIKIKDYSLSEVNLMSIPFYGLWDDLSAEERGAAGRLLSDDGEDIDLETWEGRFNILQRKVRLDANYSWSSLVTNLDDDATRLGLSQNTLIQYTGWPPREFKPFSQDKANIIPYYKYANLYEENDGNKKSLYITLLEENSNWHKIKVEFIYGNVNTYNVYITRQYAFSRFVSTSNVRYLKIISNTFTDEFDELRSIFTLYDKDNPNIYITLEIIPDYTLKLNKEKIKSFIYNGLIES